MVDVKQAQINPGGMAALAAAAVEVLIRVQVLRGRHGKVLMGAKE